MSNPDPIFRPQRAAEYLGINRTALYQWVKDGLLVKPIQIGPRAVGWRQSDLDAFIESRRAAGGGK